MKDLKMVSFISRGALTVFVTLNVFLLATKTIFGVSVSMAGVCTGLPQYEDDPNQPPIPAHDGYKNPPAGQTTTTEGGVTVPHDPRHRVGAWVPPRRFPQQQGVREKCRLTKCAKQPYVNDQGKRAERDKYCEFAQKPGDQEKTCFCPYGKKDREADEAKVKEQLDKAKAPTKKSGSSGINLNTILNQSSY